MSSFSTAAATGRAAAPDSSRVETQRPATPDPPSPHSPLRRDPYRGAMLVLLAAAFLGTLSAVSGGLLLENLVLLDVAVTLGISTGVLAGVALAQRERAKPPALQASAEAAPPAGDDSNVKRRPLEIVFEIGRRLRDLKGTDVINRIRIGTGAAGLAAIGLVLWVNLSTIVPVPLVAAMAAAVCFIGAGLAATAVRYLADLDRASIPEAPGLCRGARVVAWIP